MRKYSGKYPKRIKSIQSTAKRGELLLIANDGTKATITAKQTNGVMPKLGEDLKKYKKNPSTEIHVDINSHNQKMKKGIAKNPKKRVAKRPVAKKVTKHIYMAFKRATNGETVLIGNAFPFTDSGMKKAKAEAAQLAKQFDMPISLVAK